MMFNRMNPVAQILIENAKTFAQRNEVFALLENEVQAAPVNNALVTNLYKSVIEKSHINFEDIPQSAGDITRYVGYKSMMDSLALLAEIASKENTKIDEIAVVQDAIQNIVSFRESFERGFKLDRDFVILTYNTLVQACVESTSVLIASYVDFVKRPDRTEFTVIKNPTRAGSLAIDSLSRFNATVKTGDFSKAISAVMAAGQESFVGAGVITAAAILGAMLLIVPTIRELVFLFYYSRMRASDYLEQQAALLEINKQNIQSNGRISPKEKTAILKKQNETIAKLHRLSDKVKIERTNTENRATTELKKENSNWSLDEVKVQAASTDATGFQLM